MQYSALKELDMASIIKDGRGPLGTSYNSYVNYLRMQPSVRFDGAGVLRSAADVCLSGLHILPKKCGTPTLCYRAGDGQLVRIKQVCKAGNMLCCNPSSSRKLSRA